MGSSSSLSSLLLLLLLLSSTSVVRFLFLDLFLIRLVFLSFDAELEGPAWLATAPSDILLGHWNPL